MTATDCDSLYYSAIEAAQKGKIEGAAIEALIVQAHKFSSLDLLEESARFYERLLQIVSQAVTNGYRPSAEQLTFFERLLDVEYGALLVKMGRSERRQFVRTSLDGMQQASFTNRPI